MAHLGTAGSREDFGVANGFRIVTMHTDGKSPAFGVMRAMHSPQL
jgi:hypothetical protein